MAARWIGLYRPDALVCTRDLRRKRTTKRTTSLASFLNTLGASSVFAMALVFNCALFPQAYAQARDTIGAPLTFLFSPSEFQPASASPTAANPPSTAPVNEADVHLLAATAWAEARSEGELGMRAVAHVIINRIGDRFGEDLQTVVLSPKQFSSWNLGDPNRRLAQNPERYATQGLDKQTWETAQEVARQVLSGQSIDPTKGALFYHTRAAQPAWDHFGVGRQVIGAHIFFHDVSEGERIHTASLRPRPAHAGRVHGVLQDPQLMAEQSPPVENVSHPPSADPATGSVQTLAAPPRPPSSAS